MWTDEITVLWGLSSQGSVPCSLRLCNVAIVLNPFLSYNSTSGWLRVRIPWPHVRYELSCTALSTLAFASSFHKTNQNYMTQKNLFWLVFTAALFEWMFTPQGCSDSKLPTNKFCMILGTLNQFYNNFLQNFSLHFDVNDSITSKPVCDLIFQFNYNLDQRLPNFFPGGLQNIEFF